MVNQRFPALSSFAQRGSKPRCHLLTNGSPEAVASRLTAMVAPFAKVRARDRWMPQGFSDCSEAELDKAGRLLDERIRDSLRAWWLPVGRLRGRTPNLDIASTCEIEGSDGLLLIEAKAHVQELLNEAAGRQIPSDASEERKASHPTIGFAIENAREGLSKATGEMWRISRDSHYQVSNRFAWSWKVASLGVPVVLVYLGFVNATEMSDKGDLISGEGAWNETVMSHSEGVVPRSAWGCRHLIAGTPFIPLIRTVEQTL